MNRMRHGRLLGGLILILGVAIVVLTSHAQPTDASGPFETHSLTGMSAAEVGQYALSWTKANDQITVNGTPTVRVSRAVKSGDLANFGDLGPVDPSQYIVVLEGDFLVTVGAGGPTIAINLQPKPTKFLLEVFNQGGGLDSFGTDGTGAYVKPAVGDPTLPDSPESAPPSLGTAPVPPNDLPAPLVGTVPSSGIGPGWTTPPTPIGTSAP